MGDGFDPSLETKIPYAAEHNQKKSAFTLFLLDVYNMLRRKLGWINVSGEEKTKVQRDGGLGLV